MNRASTQYQLTKLWSGLLYEEQLYLQAVAFHECNPATVEEMAYSSVLIVMDLIHDTTDDTGAPAQKLTPLGRRLLATTPVRQFLPPSWGGGIQSFARAGDDRGLVEWRDENGEWRRAVGDFVSGQFHTAQRGGS